MRELTLSHLAETDLVSIWRFSFEQWGEAQADRYLDELQVGIRRCLSDPERGRRQEHLRAGYYSSLIRRHIAYYTFDHRSVTIQRVLHGSMQANQHLLDHHGEP